MFQPTLIMLAAAAFSIGMTVAVVSGFRAWENRESRRSPLQDRQVGHVPGQQLVDRVSDSQDDLLLSVMIMYFAVPTMVTAWALARVPAERLHMDGTIWIYAVGALGMFAWGMRDFIKHWRRRRQARDGLLTERVTGMQLNRLQAQGCIVMHDLPAEGFNIDHIVIARAGSMRLRPSHSGSRRQAKGQRAIPWRSMGSDCDFPISWRSAQWIRLSGKRSGFQRH